MHTSTIVIRSVADDGTLSGTVLYHGPFSKTSKPNSYPFDTKHKVAKAAVKDGKVYVTLRRRSRHGGMIKHDLKLDEEGNLVGSFERPLRGGRVHKNKNYVLRRNARHLVEPD